jgi:hypothetical protein
MVSTEVFDALVDAPNAQGLTIAAVTDVSVHAGIPGYNLLPGVGDSGARWHVTGGGYWGGNFTARRVL